MANKINIKKMFCALDDEMRLKLSSKIDEIYHPSTKGGESELNWIGLLKTYLPERYKIDNGFVIDHLGNISDQIDVIIYDRHFTPFIFRGENVSYIPVEGVYAIFEVKQNLDLRNFRYAVKKLNSVKCLNKTSVPFVHISGKDTKAPFDIMGGILTKGSSGKKFFNSVDLNSELSIILSLSYGIKVINQNKVKLQVGKPILAFYLLNLIQILRDLGSVPALDTEKYLDFS